MEAGLAWCVQLVLQELEKVVPGGPRDARLGKMEHSIELVREKNRAALVSFYQRHNSEKLSETEEDGTPVIDTILSKASTYTKATAEAYKQKYDAAPELAEQTGDMVTLTAEQARAVWACVAQ